MKDYFITINVEGEIKASLTKFVQSENMTLEEAIDIVKEQMIKLEKEDV